MVLIFYTLSSNYISFGYIEGNRWFKDTKMRQDRYKMAWYMSQIKKPSIIYYKSSDIGLGLLSEALPGTRYWAYQGGASKEMSIGQQNAIKNRLADFVYTNNHELPLAINDSIIRAAGYNEVYKGTLGKNHYKFYTKHKLVPPPTQFYISRWDILFRKEVFNN